MKHNLTLSEILAAEWKPAFGCTEPASVAWAAAHATRAAGVAPETVHLRCDPRTYKNCYAVGLPIPEKRTGILWALATGACLPSPDLGLSSFELADDAVMRCAAALLDAKTVTVDVDPSLTELHVDVRVSANGVTGRALLEEAHTRLVRLERNGEQLPLECSAAPSSATCPRAALAALSIEEIWDLSGTLTPYDRQVLRDGVELNLEIAQHGFAHLPTGLQPPVDSTLAIRLASWVGAGVHSRMSGETLQVMSLAGSGNKGIVVTVPVVLWGRENAIQQEEIDRALAFAILMTATSTQHLGTLSAICGAANAGGIGIASALVMMMGGSPAQVELAIHNMVGNVAGMICDGAKIGCAMKTMTGVEAAFRAARMATADVGIPSTDGIVGDDGMHSLDNLGRLARTGMAAVDHEILAIMQDKLTRS
jgi:L-cysteine desulfidase